MTSQGTEPWTVLRLLNWTRDHFERNQVDDPRLSAEVLLAHSLNCKRIELYARFDYKPDSQQLDTFRDYVRRATRHEPIAYLVGSREFYSLSFSVTPDVLIPRPETEMLVQQAQDVLKTLDGPGTLWDACTGSGCVAVAAAVQVKTLQVLATDLSDKAVAVAAGNAEKHGVADRVTCLVADGLHLPETAAEMAPFDVITANPPYIRTSEEVAESVKHEPELALYAGENGMEIVGPMIQQAPDHLRSEGALILEFGIDQADEIRDRLLATDLFYEPEIYSDLQGLDRICVAIRK